MADVDIDSFGDHDKTDSHPDEGENIPLNPGGLMGDLLGNPNVNKKQHSEERFREWKFSNNMSKCCIMCYPKT